MEFVRSMVRRLKVEMQDAMVITVVFGHYVAAIYPYKYISTN